MGFKSYFIFLISATSSLFSQIDSIAFDLTSFYQKAGDHAGYRISDYNYREEFCILKTNDSLEYILKPTTIHGPFKNASTDFHNAALFEVETINGTYSTYSTGLNKTHDSYSWSNQYTSEWTKSIVIYTYKPTFESYVLQQDDKIYGPYKHDPGLLWSNDTSTMYQVFKKDNRHFELFKNHTSLGHYKLNKCRNPRGKLSNYDDDGVHLDMFKNRYGKHFLVQNDSLFGPLNTLKMSGISYVNGHKYFSTRLIQNTNEDFCRLFRNKKDFGLQLTTDAVDSYEMFPDSSLIFKAEYLKKYEFLKNEDEVYFYHSMFGLISPPPVAKNTLIHKALQVKIISNTNFYLEGLYGENLNKVFLYKESKFIDAVSSVPVVIDNNYLYEKDGQYYMNGKNLNLPENDAFCVYHTDTFYVIKTGAKTWDLYKNRIKQQTQKVDIIANIKRFRFTYFPLEKQLVLGLETGYPWQEYPYYSYPYDVYKNQVATDVNYSYSEYGVSLYGEGKQHMTFRNNYSFVFNHKPYYFDLSKSADYQDETGWYYQKLYLKKDKAKLTIYAIRN